jgi:AcrR family transcriptional regulator
MRQFRVTSLKRKAGRYHHGRLKEALISAGRALLEQRGLQGFTLRECARRARVSHAAPAHHFGSVDDLLAEIAAQGFDELAAAMDASAAGNDDPAKRLIALGRGYVGFAIENKAVFHLMFNRKTPGEANERLARAGKAAYARLADGIDSVVPDGSHAAKQAMADLAWAGVHGFAMLAQGGQLDRDGPADPTFKRRLDLLLESIVTAIGLARGEIGSGRHTSGNSRR